MAITANGYIAKEDGNTSFVSDASWNSWDKLSRGAGNLITGRKTFKIDLADGNFPYLDRFNVVMTSQKIENKWGNKVIFTDISPKEVLEVLAKKGFKTAFIGGGGELNASFMKESLVDEIYLDIEPVIFGKGIKLFAESDLETRLELLETKMLSKNLIQLHYKVIK
ncbi:MAG: Bifunctional deaminase-reductase domain protein [Candidatus Curtissbacteria bacterium GW2011_GWD1_40_8]|nr:MAG: Bifunctional deaminase-reductase domain protein [Candidatus Curtissbacteria bacterium GW2011_GWD1_40_8]KKS01806.1 MAG: Bifunctional deaminase-reductase domain protein [Candidatus Curtissbacteria bacterium GW2011_GWC2_41_21]